MPNELFDFSDATTYASVTWDGIPNVTSGVHWESGKNGAFFDSVGFRVEPEQISGDADLTYGSLDAFTRVIIMSTTNTTTAADFTLNVEFGRSSTESEFVTVTGSTGIVPGINFPTVTVIDSLPHDFMGGSQGSDGLTDQLRVNITIPSPGATISTDTLAVSVFFVPSSLASQAVPHRGHILSGYNYR